MNHVTITVPGKPIAKARPRFFRRGSFVGTYNEQQTEEGKFMLLARQQWGDRPVLEGSVHLRCVFFFDYPKSMSIKNRLGAMHTKKPDLDNLVKFVKDCLNGIAWKDDSQITSLIADKFYGLEARTVITISPVDNSKK